MRSSDNLQSQAIALIFAFPAAASIAIALRIYSRSLTRTFAADDYVICFAGVLYWAETVTSYYVIKYQYIGYHVWEIPKDYPAVLAGKYAYATELLYNPILALVKTSILLFLLRLTGQKVAVRRTIWGLLIFNGLAMVATFLLTTFNCVPIAANWDRAAYPDANCVNFANFVTGTACVSILTDVLVLVLPTWIVYNLRIQRKQKVLLIGILSFGLLTVVSGIVRVVLLDNYDRHPPKDYTYSVLFCVSTIEVGLAFIAACAPSLKPLIVAFLPRLFRTRSRSGDKYRYHHPSGPGYALEERERRTQQSHSHSTAFVEAGAAEDKRGPLDLNPGHSDKNTILMTTETEVRWYGSGQVVVDDGSSVESLMQPVK